MGLTSSRPKPIFTKRIWFVWNTGIHGVIMGFGPPPGGEDAQDERIFGWSNWWKGRNWMRFEVCCKQWWGWNTSKIERFNWDLTINILVALQQLNILPLFWEIIVCSPASKKDYAGAWTRIDQWTGWIKGQTPERLGQSDSLGNVEIR